MLIPQATTADITAKSALSLPVTRNKFPASDLILRVSQFCTQEWQDRYLGLLQW